MIGLQNCCAFLTSASGAALDYGQLERLTFSWTSASALSTALVATSDQLRCGESSTMAGAANPGASTLHQGGHPQTFASQVLYSRQ